MGGQRRLQLRISIVQYLTSHLHVAPENHQAILMLINTVAELNLTGPSSPFLINIKILYMYLNY